MHDARPALANAILDCGWGRLMYAPSFESTRALADELMKEEAGKRDIALYVQAPQLVLAEAQASLFLDPSVMFRRKLGADAPAAPPAPGVVIRRLTTRADIAAMNRLYSMRGMVPLAPGTVWEQRDSDALVYLIAEDERTGEVVGSVMGVDHALAFGDVEGGCSFWCLVVDPQTGLAGVGTSLVNQLIEDRKSVV